MKNQVTMTLVNETIKSQGKAKTVDYGAIFSFSNFSNFWKLRKTFQYQLRQMFVNSCQYLEVISYTRYCFLNKILRHYKTSTKHCQWNIIKTGIFLKQLSISAALEFQHFLLRLVRFYIKSLNIYLGMLSKKINDM